MKLFRKVMKEDYSDCYPQYIILEWLMIEFWPLFLQVWIWKWGWRFYLNSTPKLHADKIYDYEDYWDEPKRFFRIKGGSVDI